MGACISWCCPRNAEGGANQDAHEGGAYGDANGGGAYNENSPLLRGMEGEDLGHASYSEQSMLAANGDLLHSYGFQNPQAKVGSLLGGSYTNNTHHLGQGNKPQENKELLELIQTSANQILDCLALAAPSSKTGGGGGAGGIGGLNQSHSEAAELMERAVDYGKRLSAISANLANKHLKKSSESSKAPSHAAEEQLLNQASEEILTETDQILINEVSSRAQETITDFQVEIGQDLIVPFTREASSSNNHGGQ